jgi:phage/plasmid-associated DNA primase
MSKKLNAKTPKIDEIAEKLKEEEKEELNGGQDYEEQILSECLKYKSNQTLAELFHLKTTDIYCISTKGDFIFYYFDDKDALWKTTDISRLQNMMYNTIKNYLCDKLKKIKDPESSAHADITKLLIKIGSNVFMTGTIKCYAGLIYKPKFADLLDRRRDVINFKDCLYDLKKGKMRPRNRNDFFTQTLDFNYDGKKTKLDSEIRTLLLRTCNDDPELLEFNLSWFGYCLTGETKERKFLVIVGHKASNGKSTILKIFELSLPIYTLKMHSKTFNENYQKGHKQIARLKEKPIRLIYIEELDKHHLDTGLLKDFVDGFKLNNEVMYGTSEDVMIQSKLVFVSNKDPKFDNDEGVKSRGVLEEFNNKFVNEEDYIEEKGIYIKDKEIFNRFDTDNAYKMAFIRIILPYAQKYYEKRIIIPKRLTEGFEQLCFENDPMQHFIDGYFERTKDPKDIIGKEDFTRFYNNTFKAKKKFNDILSDVKRLLNYDSQAKSNGMKGIIRNIKFVGLKGDEEKQDQIFKDEIDNE